jgi:hypothetical protein
VVAYFETRGAEVVLNDGTVPPTHPTPPTPLRTPVQATTAPDEATLDLLDLIALDERHEDDYRRFVTACRTDADATTAESRSTGSGRC